MTEVYSVRCDCGADSSFTLYDTIEKARAAAEEEYEHVFDELSQKYPETHGGFGEDHWLIYVPNTGISYDWYVESHEVH
ncbi:MAG: hypothetical protein J6S14_15570 [Clostridia bacterium]|nr:hypothetical protein [Clostridia bacterium]